MAAATALEQRQALRTLTGYAVADLVLIWPQLRKVKPNRLYDVLLTLLPAIQEKYGPSAASLAADWFEDSRADAKVAGRARAVLASPPVEAQWKALLDRSLSGMFAEEQRPEATLSMLSGGLQRSVANEHRQTIVQSTRADPKSKGWARVGSGKTCGFCQMLIDRGAVYTEATAAFLAHDHCSCVASPTWAPNVTKVSFAAKQQSVNRPRSEAALNKRNQAAYKWIREHESE